MFRRKILKISFLLLIVFISLFISSCADLGGEDGDADFESYYKWFGKIYYYDSNMVGNEAYMYQIYNEYTQDETDTVFNPMVEDYYKFIYITLKEDVTLDGMGFFFKGFDDTKIRVEVYYATGTNIIQDDDLTCDMFRGTYTAKVGNLNYSFYLDGHGNCHYHSYGVDTMGNDVDTEIDCNYTTEFDDTKQVKQARVVTDASNYWRIVFNPDDPLKFDVYLNLTRRGHQIVFDYTSDFDLGTLMFSSTKNFEKGKWESFFSETYHYETTDTSVDPPVTTYQENATNILLKSGNGILIKIVNNCYDAKKYDLEQTEILFKNIVIRNNKKGS